MASDGARGVNVVVADEQDDPLQAGPLASLAREVLRAESVPSDAEVTLVLIDRGRMAEYNERYLGRSGPTDVLAFPIDHLTPGVPPVRSTGGPPPLLGDVFICPAVVAENARAAGVGYEEELALMVVHGILHLLGYDHEIDEDAELMERRERELLSRAGTVRP